MATCALANDDEGETALALRKLFQNREVGSHRVALNIPRHLTIAKFIKLPSVDDAEIHKIAKIEVLRQLPYNEEDIVDSSKVIEKFEDGYSLALLCSILNLTVDRFMRILKAADLVVEKVAFGSESLYLWFLRNSSGSEARNVLLVNVDSDYLDIDVVENGKLVFTRGVLVNVDPTVEDKILEDIAVSVETYHQSQTSNKIEQIVLCDPCARVKGRVEQLSQYLKLPIRVIDPFENIAVADGVDLKQKDTSMAGLLGLALDPDAAEINLMPKQRLAEQRRVSLKQDLVLALALSAAVFLSAFGLITKNLHDKKATFERLGAEIKKNEPQVNRVKKMTQDLGMLKEQLGARPFAIDIFASVHKITPSGMHLSLMDYEGGKSLALRGTAGQMSQVFGYAKALEKSEFFENVKIRYATKRVMDGKDIVDFEISGGIAKEDRP